MSTSVVLAEREVEQQEEDVFAAIPAVQFHRTIIDRDISVGALLKEARETHARTLAYYARKLAMPERYLRALEEEDFPSLPGLVYEKHFVHRYAEALRLESEPLVARWVALREGEAKPITKFVPRVRRRDLWISPLALRRSITAILFLAVAFYMGGRLYAMVQPPTLALASPTDSQVVRDPKLDVAGEVPTDASVTVNGQVIAPNPDGHFDVPVTLEAGANTIRVVAERRYSHPTVLERRVFLVPVNDSISVAPATSGTVIP